MATSPSAVSGLPAGYALEQPSTPPPQQGGEVTGLPQGYKLESASTDSTPAAQPKAPNAYQAATASGPYAHAGAAEKAMGAEMGDNKAQAKEALKNTAMAAGYTAGAMVPGVGGAASDIGSLVDAAGQPIGDGAESVMQHLASSYGKPAMDAIKEAAAAHPIVAKLLMHGIEFAGLQKVGKYLSLFGK